ncbi:MAG: Asp-tRNA(Asn)/Glu-tRNA(Gln) amidotransferase subunit GatB [Clostridia bacterium]|nr:Asp-tRNA(Asn)/Glu-tRNA(Gln) amidotransferase subunit GatB [Clostridia bacterium]
MSNQAFEAVIGLEVHAELLTATKIFCSCSTAFGAEPNTQCCPICMGYPGAMPRLNRRAVELAIRAGLALGCEIAEVSQTDRKQYFYPDLPKAYQISQDESPLCKNGFLTVSTKEGTRRVAISRIHIEEDAGKLIHRGAHTFVDCNRCGVPLIEIVSAPDLRSPEEASAYLRKLRSILLTCGISDCRMQEGSLRCDVNISLRPFGSETFGVRTEIKNLNSFAFVEKAIAYEIARQTEALLQGNVPIPETRRFDAAAGKTYPMRAKETSVDYRFLPEPDLPPIWVSEEDIERLRTTLPELPDARALRLAQAYGLTVYDASVLVSEPQLADFFEAGAGKTDYPKLLVNLLLSELLRHCASDPFSSPVSASRLAELSQLMGEGTVNSATAKKLLLRLLDGDLDPRLTVKREGLAQVRDREQLLTLAERAMEEQPRAVTDYRNGKSAALRALQGKVMALSGGRADPILLESIFLELLSPHSDETR